MSEKIPGGAPIDEKLTLEYYLNNLSPDEQEYLYDDEKKRVAEIRLRIEVLERKIAEAEALLNAEKITDEKTEIQESNEGVPPQEVPEVNKTVDEKTPTPKYQKVTEGIQSDNDTKIAEIPPTPKTEPVQIKKEKSDPKIFSKIKKWLGIGLTAGVVVAPISSNVPRPAMGKNISENAREVKKINNEYFFDKEFYESLPNVGKKNARRIYEFFSQPENQNFAYSILDKETGRLYIIDKNGKKVADFPATYGELKGEMPNRTDFTNNINISPTTPMGCYFLSGIGIPLEAEAEYGNNLFRVEGINAPIYIHQIPNGLETETMNAMMSPTPDDNHLKGGWGCIRVTQKDFEVLKKYFNEHMPFIVTPDDPNLELPITYNEYTLKNDPKVAYLNMSKINNNF